MRQSPGASHRPSAPRALNEADLQAWAEARHGPATKADWNRVAERMEQLAQLVSEATAHGRAFWTEEERATHTQSPLLSSLDAVIGHLPEEVLQTVTQTQGWFVNGYTKPWPGPDGAVRGGVPTFLHATPPSWTCKTATVNGAVWLVRDHAIVRDPLLSADAIEELTGESQMRPRTLYP